MTTSELRVHGVSGTPPEDILYTRPVSYDLSDRSAKVYEASKDPYRLSAFHWGSLTAGRPITALWILLAPFAMANVAGWTTDRANPWTRAMIRLAGLALTGIFFAQVANMTMQVPFEIRIAAFDHPRRWMLWLLVLTALVNLGGLGILSTQSGFRRLGYGERLRLVFSPLSAHLAPADISHDPGDPAHEASMASPRMWRPHPIVHRLRRLHIAFGALVLALAVGAAGGQLMMIVPVAGMLVVGFVMLVTTWVPRSAVAIWPTAALPLVSVLWLGYVGWRIAGDASFDRGPTAADDATFGLGLILLVLALFAVFGEWVKAGPGVGWVSLGVLAIALLAGASLGLTGGLLIADLLSPDETLRTFETGGAWTSLMMAGLGVVLAITAVVIALTGPAATPPLARIILRARLLLITAGVYAVVAGVLTAFAACLGGPGCDRSRLPVPAWAAEDPLGVIDLAGLSFDLSSLLGWLKLVVVVVPAALMVNSVLRGLVRGQEARRKVSVLWDIGSFWPRWYHPLAPPAYPPNAVSRLAEEVTERKPDVLAAHSQGSLIATAAVALVARQELPRLFLTYGSPLGGLYPSLFPSVGLSDLIETADTRLGNSWLNLWRRSDPIGGSPIGSLGERNWHVSAGKGHSRYELTPEYCSAREAGFGGSYQKPPEADLSDCWERLFSKAQDGPG